MSPRYLGPPVPSMIVPFAIRTSYCTAELFRWASAGRSAGDNVSTAEPSNAFTATCARNFILCSSLSRDHLTAPGVQVSADGHAALVGDPIGSEPFPSDGPCVGSYDLTSRLVDQ